MADSIYGKCSKCENDLEPVWYTEHEERFEYGLRVKTGRTRTACSHLLCPYCGNVECVDESFDGPWVSKPKKF